MNSDQKAQLTGGPDKTVTWIWLEDGQLKVDYYDFSEDVQRLFGNDIAYTITVDEMGKMLAISNQEEASLIPWMAQYFKSYFGIKQWLEESEIEFHIVIESWA